MKRKRLISTERPARTFPIDSMLGPEGEHRVRGANPARETPEVPDFGDPVGARSGQEALTQAERGTGHS